MSQRPTKSSMKLLRLVAMALLVGLTVVSVGRGAFPASGTVTSKGSWPIRVTYTLDESNGEESRHQEYSLEANDWTSWQQITTCCDLDEGLTTELHPDGTFWSGGLPGLPVSEVFQHPGGDGMVPLPDFAPRFPTDTSELEANSLVTVLADLATGEPDEPRDAVFAMADRLGVAPTDLLAYRVDRTVLANGVEQDATDIRWVYKPINLTVYNEELLDGQRSRLMTVTSLEFLPEGFTIDFHG